MRGFDDDSELDQSHVSSSSTHTPTPSSSSASRSNESSRVTPISSPFKSATPNRTTPSRTTPIVTSALRTVPDYDEEVFGASGRKKRLAALAQKFQHYNQDDDEALPSTPVASTPKLSPPSNNDDLNLTKEIDVDEELASINATPTAPRLTGRLMPAGHTPTKNLAKDPDFVNSLKAQGFEETTSKSKLVYDFNKADENHARSRPTSPYKQRATTILSSPTRNATEPRPSSPHKPHPLQFVSPQVNRDLAPKSPGANPRSASPTKTPNPRPTSPYKPHPLQFVSASPQHKAPLAPTPKPDSVARPAKPSRTWAFAHLENKKEEEEKKTWKTETTVHVTPLRPVVKEQAENSDTASRRSISEKMNLFENEAKPEPVSPAIDPAMMSMSDRRALFEKNRTAPKPIARFGDAVTPSMLSRYLSRILFLFIFSSKNFLICHPEVKIAMRLEPNPSSYSPRALEVPSKWVSVPSAWPVPSRRPRQRGSRILSPLPGIMPTASTPNPPLQQSLLQSQLSRCPRPKALLHPLPNPK